METSLHNVPNELMAAKAPHHDESTAIFIHKYLTNNNYRSLIAISLIFMFSLVFYLFYLLVDAFIDKQKHYELCVKSFERYEKRCRAKAKMLAKQQQQQQGEQNDEQAINDKAEQLENPKDIELGENENEMAKSKAQERERKLAFTEWSTRNLQISFIHSVLSSLWLIRIFIVRYEPLLADLVFYVSWDTYLLVAFSAGYFLYDFYDIYANGYVKREWVVCLHHVIVLISFTYHLCMLQSIGYTCLALAMEFNSVFLHARKLLSFYMFGKRSLAYLVNMVGNVTTFVTFRFGTLGLIYFGIYRDGPRVPLTYLVVLILLVSMMAIINVLLFRRVVQRDVLPLICGPSSCSSARKHKKSKKAKNQQQHDDAAPIDDKATLMVDHHGHLLTSDNLPIINNAQSNVVLVMVE